MDGKLPCTFVTHAVLGGYTVQAELGDYDEINHGDRVNINGLSGFEYLEGFCFAPNQTPELLDAIANCHMGNKYVCMFLTPTKRRFIDIDTIIILNV